ncbi:hypothetical protein V5279_21620 [Bradyrhizobium sp. 26S5]|uniref:hypothetical protein n=1 Tax=Bradyrhizobium sp. 26S5 TaxID=3139729 RepID=UPI0030D2C12C
MIKTGTPVAIACAISKERIARERHASGFNKEVIDNRPAKISDQDAILQTEIMCVGSGAPDFLLRA